MYIKNTAVFAYCFFSNKINDIFRMLELLSEFYSLHVPVAVTQISLSL